jgi:hypothetical protein
MKFKLSLCLVVIMIVLSMGTAQAATITFTSTADFDAGTKGPTANGNLGIETGTDNPGIATGAFELGSLKGDAFNTADADADTAKWNLYDIGAPSASTRTISGGVLSLSVTGNIVARNVVSSSTLSGDWDVRFYLDASAYNNGQFESFLINQQARCGSGTGTEDGFGFLQTDTSLSTYKCVNGAFVLVGTVIAAQADPIWHRFTRAETGLSDTFTSYTSTNGIAWTQIHQTTDASIPNPMYAMIGGLGFAPGPLTATWDNFHVAAGTVDAGGFRTAGTWTSATQTFTTEIVQGITVTYSGASAAGYIDAIRIVDALGATLFTDDTNRISGTSVTLTVPDADNLEQDWAARILLAGDGSATATVESVVVTTGARPSNCFGTSTFGAVLFATFGIIAGVSIFSAVYFGLLSEESRTDVQTLSALVISVVVLVAIISAFLPAFFMGATIGC